MLLRPHPTVHRHKADALKRQPYETPGSPPGAHGDVLTYRWSKERLRYHRTMAAWLAPAAIPLIV
jgi:hypothetical protein